MEPMEEEGRKKTHIANEEGVGKAWFGQAGTQP